MAGDTGNKAPENNSNGGSNNTDSTGNNTGDGGSDGGDSNGDASGKNDDKGEGSKKKETMVSYNALHEEREKRKAAQAELDAFKKAEEERLVKAAEKKGEHQKLYHEEKAKRSSLEAEKQDLEAKVLAFEEAAKARIESSITSLRKEEDQATVRELLAAHPLSAQESLLPKIMTNFGGAKNINSGVSDKGGEGGENSRENAYKKALADNDPLGAIRNAPSAL